MFCLEIYDKNYLKNNHFYFLAVQFTLEICSLIFAIIIIITETWAGWWPFFSWGIVIFSECRDVNVEDEQSPNVLQSWRYSSSQSGFPWQSQTVSQSCVCRMHVPSEQRYSLLSVQTGGVVGGVSRRKSEVRVRNHINWLWPSRPYFFVFPGKRTEDFKRQRPPPSSPKGSRY